jgi:lon-related putative ATP-dependent protease
MSEFVQLSRKDLEMDFNFLPAFENTLEISPYKDIIGQERAVEAIDIGLQISKKGYNIYVCGNNGTGKRSYVINRVLDYAKGKPSPPDWCYVYNFSDPYKPIALMLNSGTAYEFKNDIEYFVNELFEEVPRAFSMEDYEKERNSIVERYQKEIIRLADRLHDESKERAFSVKSTNDGFAFVPLKEDKEMSEKEYNELVGEEKEEINSKVSYLKLIALEVLRNTKNLKKDMTEELKKLDDTISLEIISKKINELKDKYGYNKKINDYLEDIKTDIIENIDAFMDYEGQEEKYDDSFFKRYYVNVMVCNGNVEGVPVIYEDIPEYHNLLGIVEYENKQGSLVTDFTMIQPGSLHKANGGYIIVDAYQLLTSYQGWEALKRSLKSNYIFIENLKNQFDIIPIVTLKPEEIPLDVKIVLVGSPMLYNLLYNVDDNFKELFKIKSDFDDDIRNIDGTAMKILGFISHYCDENKLLPVARDGIIDILKYACRMAENKKYFTASMNRVVDLIEQAGVEASASGKKFIDSSSIKNTIKSMEKRHGLFRDKILSMYKDGVYIVELKGYKIGQINGLSVIDIGDTRMGKQNRITVATFAGKDGVINIERETNMSGNIHSKGIMILSGYMGETFGQNTPLSFNASICFEQLYGEVDGDSASAAELIALMSSLGDIPIKQSFAVTGSVNQKGEIQPVGGINEKIEGFFDICSIYGLDGNQGVIIPYANIDNIVLKDEVISAVEEGLFKIYGIKRIDDCFEILCDETVRARGRRKAIEMVRENITNKLEKYRNSFADKNKK